MADASQRRPPPDSEVVRTRRVEVLDASDRVRIVIGQQPGLGAQDLPGFGITLTGPNGSVQADLVGDAAGAKLSFLSSGNAALELGADDLTTLVADRGGTDLLYAPAGTAESEVVAPGPFIVFCEPDGTPLIEWRGRWQGPATPGDAEARGSPD